MKRPLTLTLFSLAALAAWGGEPNPLTAPSPPSSRPALVRFHTACANCHAGECSGRLSFLSGKGGAQRHIHNYAPSADPKMVRELFVLLTTVKRTCEAELPPPEAVPARWTPEQLREWNNPDLNAWFIPVGELGPGPVTVELDPGVEARAGRAQLLDGELETIAEVPLKGEAVVLKAQLRERGRCFLRVYGAKAVQTVRVVLPQG